MTCFLDSGYLIALAVQNEQRHTAARLHWKQFLSESVPLLTTSFVLDETVTYINSRGAHAAAVEMGLLILESPAIELLHVDVGLLNDGWNYFVRHDDKRYSLTDCISFAVMQTRGLRQALTFDRHFARAGFECLPQI